MNKRMLASPILSLAFWALLAGLPAQAMQLADLANPVAATLKISRGEATRLAAESGRITALRVKDGLLQVDADEEHGQLFLTLRSEEAARTEPISAFVTLDDGSTHTLSLQPADIPAETILLRKAPRPLPPYQPAAGDHSQQLRRLVSALATGAVPQGARQRSVFAPRQLAAELELMLEHELSDGALTGERYRLVNRSNAEQVIDERLFYRPGVLAVAIDSRKLAAQESTAVYVVRGDGRE